MGKIGTGLSVAELILTNLWNFVISVLFTLGGALGVWYGLTGSEGWWFVLVGLGMMAYGLYGFYKVFFLFSQG